MKTARSTKTSKKTESAIAEAVAPGYDKRSQSTSLVELALSNYELGVTPGGEPFAVPCDGPRFARTFRGTKSSLRSELAASFYDRYGRSPSGSAIADALATLEGFALRTEPRVLALRVARHRDSIIVDLGDETGRVVQVKPKGWRVVNKSPVLFRRTKLTGSLPEPERGGALDELRSLLNMTDKTWPLAAAWLVSAFIPDVPHPVALITGMQGTGKSTAGRMLCLVVDPSEAPLRSAPRDEGQWITAAAGSWVVALDNISTIPPWLSDSLCRAVTGDGDVRRRQYTDDDLTVFSFRRVILLTSIDPGAMRGDLGDRLLPLELDGIADDDRRKDDDFTQAFEKLRPRVFAGLLDLLANVLSVLPEINLDRHSRMADFDEILAAVDRVLHTEALATYLRLRDEIGADVVAGDVMASAIRDMVHEGTVFRGSYGELRDELESRVFPKSIPRSEKGVASALKKLAPSLARVGVEVDFLGRQGHDKRRRVTIQSVNRADHADLLPTLPSVLDETAEKGGTDKKGPETKVRKVRTVRLRNLPGAERSFPRAWDRHFLKTRLTENRDKARQRRERTGAREVLESGAAR
jgi:hypothetical protein